jgi:two-component system, OmpR family, KDP operon response regulator KdpE
MQVLLIGDNESTRQLLIRVLQEHGHECVLSTDTSICWQLAHRKLDLALYDLQSNSTADWEDLVLWRQKVDLPFVVLGLQGDLDSELVVRILRAGADDYVPRPLRLAELLARMKALRRRAQMSSPVIWEKSKSCADIHLDSRTLQAKVNGRCVDLTPTEFKILDLLVRRRGQVVSCEEMDHALWNEDGAGREAFLKSYIWHLRHKIETDPQHPEVIVNRRGMGYVLRGEE